MRSSSLPVHAVLAAFLVLWVLPASAAAQAPAAEGPLTLAAAVERALGRFPAVESARARQREAREALGEAETGLRPRGRLNASAIQYQEPTHASPPTSAQGA